MTRVEIDAARIAHGLPPIYSGTPRPLTAAERRDYHVSDVVLPNGLVIEPIAWDGFICYQPRARA